MIQDDQVPMFPHLPSDVTEIPKKERRAVNDLQESILWLMEKKDLRLSEIQKGVNNPIPWGTLMGWHNGDVAWQKVDSNLFELWQVMRCPLEFLLFGVGSDEDDENIDLKIELGKYRKEVVQLRREKKLLEEKVKMLNLYISAHLAKAV